MRRLILAAVLMSAAGWAMAQEPRPESQEPQKPAQRASDSKEMTATVVATDPTVKTITVKKEAAGATAGAASEQVFPVDDKALSNLKMTKAGEKVTLILKSDPATGKETVTSIEKPKGSTQEPR